MSTNGAPTTPENVVEPIHSILSIRIRFVLLGRITILLLRFRFLKVMHSHMDNRLHQEPGTILDLPSIQGER